jgi:hypothetical protein
VTVAAVRGVSEAPLSSGNLMGLVEALFFVLPHASNDAVGEVSFVGAACFSSGFAFIDFAVDVDAGFVDVALLGDASDVEHTVDPPVPMS